MTNARPTMIKIVKERDTDGYTVFLRHSNGTDQPLEEHLESVTDAQARARYYAEQFTDDVGSTVTVEPWTDADGEESQ